MPARVGADGAQLNKGATMRTTLAILLMAVILTPQAQGYFFSYPRDGQFKQQEGRSDPWYYKGDANWEIQAPDKWQHMMGSYASSEVFSLFMDNKLAGGIVLSLGVLKEVEDGFREGWSVRDIFMDAVGVGASLINNKKYKLWCDWNRDSIQFKVSITLK